MCVKVDYPTRCVNLDTVKYNVTTRVNGTGTVVNSFPVHNVVESVLVADVEDASTADRCIVLFENFHCQGRALILNGSSQPGAQLSKYGASNRVVSIRQCTPKLLKWLQDHPKSDKHVMSVFELNEIA